MLVATRTTVVAMLVHKLHQNSINQQFFVSRVHFLRHFLADAVYPN